MKRQLLSAILFAWSITGIAVAQDLKEKDVPSSVKSVFTKKYPNAKKVSWEKEKGNFEANWGGKSGEDSSALFTPSAIFVEIVVSIPINQLPASVSLYVNKNYMGAKTKEAGKITDASGKHMFEVEIKGRDLIFDEKGAFIKED
ncbi:MAG TPA: PepSY-like domain-containing protein [Puia sp.]